MQGLPFAKHSVALLQPLVKDRDAPFSILDLLGQVRRVPLNILLQDEFTERDIFTLDRKIFKYQAALDAVPEYDGYKKPKDAFSFLYVINILRNGPPRCYWCMTYEAFNQVYIIRVRLDDLHDTSRSTRNLGHAMCVGTVHPAPYQIYSLQELVLTPLHVTRRTASEIDLVPLRFSL